MSFVMLERSEASQKPRNCHPSCRGGVGPPKKRRKITKQQDLSCWNEVKHLKNRETVIHVLLSIPSHYKTPDLWRLNWKNSIV